MKQISLTLTMLLSLLSVAVNSSAQGRQTKAISQQKQQLLTPQRALELLKEGNQRFLSNQMKEYDFVKEMKITTKKGQHPLAVILSCIDSRSIPELLFDQGLGNIFVSRIAGNVADKEIFGSMEFATKLAGARLIIVMGHTHCGAVQGACSMNASTGLPNLDYLLNKIKPAVSKVKQSIKTLNCQNPENVDMIAKQNVLDQIQLVLTNSPAIQNMVTQKQINIIGAMHDIKTGRVIFFDSQGNTL